MTTNNLHRSLAPMSPEAWADMEDSIREKFTQRIASRRVTSVPEAAGYEFSSLPTGKTAATDLGADGVAASARVSYPVVELPVPFKVSRTEADNVLRGEVDADWSPAEDAAAKLSQAEDSVVFRGVDALGIRGIKSASLEEHDPVELPEDVSDYPNAVTRAITQLRLAGVSGPYDLVLGATHYQAVSEGTEYGVPVYDHLVRQLKEGRIIWAPNLNDAVLMSNAGGDYELHLGQDVSVGYESHDAEYIELYLEETLTFRTAAPEAAIILR